METVERFRCRWWYYHCTVHSYILDKDILDVLHWRLAFDPQPSRSTHFYIILSRLVTLLHINFFYLFFSTFFTSYLFLSLFSTQESWNFISSCLTNNINSSLLISIHILDYQSSDSYSYLCLLFSILFTKFLATMASSHIYDYLWSSACWSRFICFYILSATR